MQVATKPKIVRRSAQFEFVDTDNKIPPLLKRIFAARGLKSADELEYSLNKLIPPDSLKDIATATARLHTAFVKREKILIVGDYDVDGATATALAILGLRAMGAAAVEYLSPNRFEHGYGLSVQIAQEVIARKPNLVITVDNGIASINGVAALNAAGIAVIITDHHLPGEELPKAAAIINPNQVGCKFPSKNLAGVGVLFYLLLATRTKLRDENWFADKDAPNLAKYLDLVALGTVADMVALDYNNRILVTNGLNKIRCGQGRLGMHELLSVANTCYQNISCEDLGFVIAPRINAAGRMHNIATGVECLLAEDQSIAHDCAQTLDAMNKSRRALESGMQKQALRIAANLRRDTEQMCLCLFDKKWHKGLVGLVASRLKDKFNIPVIAFAADDDGKKISGSARAVRGLHIRDLLSEIATRSPDLIEKFGGHAMAAGLTIAADRFDDFAKIFNKLCTAHFKNNGNANEIFTDGELHADDFNLATAQLLNHCSPWGVKFPPPIFDGEFAVKSIRVVGDAHLKMQLATERGGMLEAIAFRQISPGQKVPQYKKIHAVYKLNINEYRDIESLQLILEYIEPRA